MKSNANLSDNFLSRVVACGSELYLEVNIEQLSSLLYLYTSSAIRAGFSMVERSSFVDSLLEDLEESWGTINELFFKATFRDVLNILCLIAFALEEERVPSRVQTYLQLQKIIIARLVDALEDTEN